MHIRPISTVEYLKDSGICNPPLRRSQRSKAIREYRRWYGHPPDTAKRPRERPRSGSRCLICLAHLRLGSRERRVKHETRPQCGDGLSEDPFCCRTVFIKQDAQSHTEGLHGKAEDVERFVPPEAGEEDHSEDRAGDGNQHSREHLHAGAGGRAAEHGLEVDGQEEEQPVEDYGVEKGGDEDDDGGTVGEQAGGQDRVLDRGGGFVPEEEGKAEEAEDERGKDAR